MEASRYSPLRLPSLRPCNAPLDGLPMRRAQLLSAQLAHPGAVRLVAVRAQRVDCSPPLTNRVN